MKRFIEWLKWCVAGREMEELHRWRTYWEESRRWLAEFPDAANALEHLKAQSTGAGGVDIMRTREAMRTRRDGRAMFAEVAQRGQVIFTPAEKLIAEEFGIGYPK